MPPLLPHIIPRHPSHTRTINILHSNALECSLQLNSKSTEINRFVFRHSVSPTLFNPTIHRTSDTFPASLISDRFVLPPLIDRSDIEGYEAFVREYPSSIHVSDAQERIQVAKKEIRLRKEEERRQREEEERIREEAERRQREEEQQREQLYSAYGSNSLNNGSQPYESFYGKNHRYSSGEPHAEVRVKAAHDSDVIVIIRYDNQNGRVAGHTYVRAGQTATIQLPGGHRYQTFFYYGRGWYPDKPMKNGVKGGFLEDEIYSKDGSPALLQDNEVLSFELIPVQNGNFSTSQSNEGEIF